MSAISQKRTTKSIIDSVLSSPMWRNPPSQDCYLEIPESMQLSEDKKILLKKIQDCLSIEEIRTTYGVSDITNAMMDFQLIASTYNLQCENQDESEDCSIVFHIAKAEQLAKKCLRAID